MLSFALSHMRERVMARLQAAIAALGEPTRRDLIRAASAVMLPVDPAGREEACVNIAFFSAATVTPAYAEQLRDGHGRILTVSVANFREASRLSELRDGIDPEVEAPALYFLTQGLVGPILVGLYSPNEALALIDAQLDRVFSSGIVVNESCAVALSELLRRALRARIYDRRGRVEPGTKRRDREAVEGLIAAWGLDDVNA